MPLASSMIHQRIKKRKGKPKTKPYTIDDLYKSDLFSISQTPCKKDRAKWDCTSVILAILTEEMRDIRKEKQLPSIQRVRETVS